MCSKYTGALTISEQSVKTSFELFSKGLKDDGLAGDYDDEEEDASRSDADLDGDVATADMETKIARFEAQKFSKKIV